LHDANGNPTRWEYDERGRKAKEIRTNGAQYVYSYTGTGQLTTTTDPKGNVKSYVYNRDGTLAQIGYAVAAGTSATPNVSLTYDAAYKRVQTVTDGTGTTRYSYHPVGSPTSKVFTYDLNGNMTSDGARTYEWDAENRLVAVKEGGVASAAYTYRRDGIRMSKTGGGVASTYLLEGPSVVEVRLSTGGVTKHFQGPGTDNVVAMQDGAGVVTYFTRDHLGSAREHVTAEGTVTLRRRYDPWGRLLSGAAAGGWAFTGRENEAETSLYYYRARYYSPSLGRWASADPAGRVDGPNLYSYVGNNPAVRIDPTGLVVWDCTIVSLGYGGGAVLAKCTSRCMSMNEEQVRASYVGSVLGFGADLGWIELDDGLPVAKAGHLEGRFASGGVGVRVGPANLGIQAVIMGEGIGYDLGDLGFGGDTEVDPDKGGFWPKPKKWLPFDFGAGGFVGAVASVAEWKVPLLSVTIRRGGGDE
jgi:RHS repeat-associated protein